MPNIPKDFYSIKNGKVVRKNDFEKEPSSHLPPINTPIEPEENKIQLEPLNQGNIPEFSRNAIKALTSIPELQYLNDIKRKEILFGDIGYSKEYDKYIKENDSSENIGIAHGAILARETEYIVSHLLRWIEEKTEDDKNVTDWYKYQTNAFLLRLRIPLQASCESIKKILTMRREFSHLKNEFETCYSETISVAKRCDKEKLSYVNRLPIKSINDFKAAIPKFLEINMMIHSAANEELGRLLKTAKKESDEKPGKNGDKYKKRRRLLKKVMKAKPEINDSAAELADCPEIEEYKKYIKQHFQISKRQDVIQTIRNDLRAMNR